MSYVLGAFPKVFQLFGLILSFTGLELANYEEKIVQPTPRKVFTAKLVDYADKAGGGPSVNGKKGKNLT